jgi:hypothetical protein
LALTDPCKSRFAILIWSNVKLFNGGEAAAFHGGEAVTFVVFPEPRRIASVSTSSGEVQWIA